MPSPTLSEGEILLRPAHIVLCHEQEQLDSLLQMDGEWKVRIILSDFALRLMRRQSEAILSLPVAISDSFLPVQILSVVVSATAL